MVLLLSHLVCAEQLLLNCVVFLSKMILKCAIYAAQNILNCVFSGVDAVGRQGQARQGLHYPQRAERFCLERRLSCEKD